MIIELLMKHVAEAVKMHLGFLEIDDVEGGFIMPHEINDDEVTYRLVVKRPARKTASVENGKTENDDIGFTQSCGSSNTCKTCPRGKTTNCGCEYYDNGTCRGVVYPTYPPQYDPCVFTGKLVAKL